MAKRRIYSDKFKAGAVVMVESEGYPDDKFALQRVADNLKINVRTLRRWVNNDTGAPPDKIVQQEKSGLIDLIEDEIRAGFKEMNSARQDASYRDIGTVIGILFDKAQLLRGKPTTINEEIEQIDDYDLSSFSDEQLEALARGFGQEA